jgi:hypothetical protein
MLPKPVSALILDNVIRRLHETEISPEDALDEISELDPDTTLGRAMTEVMVLLVNLKLFDFYLGYDREENVIKMHVGRAAPPEAMKDLTKAIEQEIETPDVDPDQRSPIIKTKLYRKTTSDDSDWVLELTVVTDEVDDGSGLPVVTDIGGEVEVSGKEEEEQPVVPEPEEEEK